ncbi:hypothetical protein K2173_003502 [Erythroxylum novogranatense]|uniref:Alpha 1,4-glycosyltransferase domain-containing protein n=1 Tax=Erythroxylum novogranatense TaxID=1862640 RepID=A0AAV8TAI2_9ROSI|nr:hypothetical protein K2173_003502 [Erythroxylum novogranatense]
MLRGLKSRRRPRYGAQLCALISALLLLFSVSLLYNRLSSSHLSSDHRQHHLRSGDGDQEFYSQRVNGLISDSDENPTTDDKIDELDTFEDQRNYINDDLLVDGDQESEQPQIRSSISSSGYVVDHLTGSIRRAVNRRSIDEWDFDYSHSSFNVALGGADDDKNKGAFASDDVPIDELVRRKVSEVKGIEDALLLKVGKRSSPLREGWGDWFDKKGDFLRRDRMFKSNLEVLNPMHNPLLQDPDGVGATGLTRGDKAVQKIFFNEFKKTPFLLKKPLNALEVKRQDIQEKGGEHGRGSETEVDFKARSEMKKAERRTLDQNLSHGSGGDNLSNGSGGQTVHNVNNKSLSAGIVAAEENNSNKSYLGRTYNYSGDMDSETSKDSVKQRNASSGELRQMGGVQSNESKAQHWKSEELTHVYADGKRWGYFPGLHPHLSFSDFMISFLRKGKCRMRVFMVWNSPPWMYSVRHQRGLESLLANHREACVVLFSETIELDFFKNSFVKDGYKVAVAMPNLDELLKDTPAHIFASVWLQWKKTKFYPIHYSELVRLAALYKYGGIYLDSDVIVLSTLSLLNNTVGQEDQLAGSSLNGAVMAFGKHSPFIMDCLKEYYMTYDDTQLKWNGAELLTRVARNFSGKEDKLVGQEDLHVQHSDVFLPIASRDITRFFTAPGTEIERTQQDAFFKKILSDSLTFHFWNSLTSALIPEPESLVARLIDYQCVRCSDVL